MCFFGLGLCPSTASGFYALFLGAEISSQMENLINLVGLRKHGKIKYNILHISDGFF